MTTMADMIADVRRSAYGSMSEQINFVSTAYTAGDTSLVLELDVTGITPGVLLSCGLNTWYVKDVVPATNTVIVASGIDGAPDNDIAVGEMVFIRPRVTGWWIFDQLRTDIRAMSSPSDGLYQVMTGLAVSDGYDPVYDLPVERIERVARVRWLEFGYSDKWCDLSPNSFIVDGANGIIRLTRMIPAGASVQFVYTTPFTDPVYLTDDPVADCGLAESMLDIPVLGATAALLLTTEARKNQVQVQGDPRRAGEVQTGGNANAARYFLNMRKSRVNDEYARLLRQLPLRQSV